MIYIEFFFLIVCLSVIVKWLAVKTASEMTYTVSGGGGALNSTQWKPIPTSWTCAMLASVSGAFCRFCLVIVSVHLCPGGEETECSWVTSVICSAACATHNWNETTTEDYEILQRLFNRLNFVSLISMLLFECKVVCSFSICCASEVINVLPVEQLDKYLYKSVDVLLLCFLERAA